MSSPTFGDEFHVTVVCGGDTYHLHSDMLTAKSKFFATALDIAMVEKQMGRIIVKEVSPETFKKVVHFFHENKLEDEEEGMDLGEMLEAADRFDMEGLKSEISERVKDSINISNLLTISKLAETFHAKQLLGDCTKFCMDNSVVLTKEEVAEHPELVLALLVEKDKAMKAPKEERSGAIRIRLAGKIWQDLGDWNVEDEEVWSVKGVKVEGLEDGVEEEAGKSPAGLCCEHWLLLLLLLLLAAGCWLPLLLLAAGCCC